MICSHCGEESPNAWCMYQLEGDRVISKLFTESHIPEGWYDSPKAARASKEVKKEVKVKRTRRTPAQMAEARAKQNEGVDDVDSSGNSKQGS